MTTSVAEWSTLHLQCQTIQSERKMETKKTDIYSEKKPTEKERERLREWGLERERLRESERERLRDRDWERDRGWERGREADRERGWERERLRERARDAERWRGWERESQSLRQRGTAACGKDGLTTDTHTCTVHTALDIWTKQCVTALYPTLLRLMSVSRKWEKQKRRHT